MKSSPTITWQVLSERCNKASVPLVYLTSLGCCNTTTGILLSIEQRKEQIQALFGLWHFKHKSLAIKEKHREYYN